MKTGSIRWTTTVVVASVVVLGALAIAYVVIAGVSAKPQPGRVEAFVARTVRTLAIARHAPDLQNPVPDGQESIAEGRAHFADHCASCHANDGSGNTEIGRNLYPKAPDMRQPPTQSLSDGELFYIIHNGIRLTGMPAWGNNDPAADADSWKLVHFIRHLPQVTPEEIDEMKKLNPKSPHEMEEEEAARRFLMGEGESPPSEGHHH